MTMTHIYELRYDADENYWSIGFFLSIEDIKERVASFDGPEEGDEGGPLSDYGEDGEDFDVVMHRIGTLSSDGTGGVHVASIRRESVATDDGEDWIWKSTWTMTPSPFEIEA